MLRLLQCAVALDEHRNYARAADDIGISQPTLTRNIQELERVFGAKMFDRNRRGVVPTAFGEVALNSARRIAINITELNREIALLKGLHSGHLTIGVGPLVVQTWIGHAIGSLLAKHPNVSVRVVELEWWCIAGALHGRSVDLAVGESQVSTDDDEIVIEDLPQRAVYLYCRSGHPLLSAQATSISDIGHYPLASPRLPKRASELLINGKEMGKMSDCGQYFEPRIQCQSLDAVLDIVKASDAVGLATAAKLAPALATGDIRIIPFEAPWFRTRYAIMHLRDRTLAPAALAFCAEVRAAEARYNETALTPGPTPKKSKRTVETPR
jgi:DNA-binding transcriptional LysR family regulator